MREFHLKTPEHSTQKRMIEVQFYLIVQELQKRLSDTIYFDNIMENLCLLYQTKYTHINFAINNLQTITGKPSHLDLALAHKYLNIPMRQLCKIGRVSPNIIYRELTKYIEENSPDLSPRLGESVIDSLEIFNMNFAKMIQLLPYVTKINGDIYDKY